MKYEIDPSANLADYYIYGGSNDSAVSLNLVEKISTNSPLFNYENSYPVYYVDSINKYICN